MMVVVLVGRRREGKYGSTKRDKQVSMRTRHTELTSAGKPNTTTIHKHTPHSSCSHKDKTEQRQHEGLRIDASVRRVDPFQEKYCTVFDMQDRTGQRKKAAASLLFSESSLCGLTIEICKAALFSLAFNAGFWRGSQGSEMFK